MSSAATEPRYRIEADPSVPRRCRRRSQPGGCGSRERRHPPMSFWTCAESHAQDASSSSVVTDVGGRRFGVVGGRMW